MPETVKRKHRNESVRTDSRVIVISFLPECHTARWLWITEIIQDSFCKEALCKTSQLKFQMVKKGERKRSWQSPQSVFGKHIVIHKHTRNTGTALLFSIVKWFDLTSVCAIINPVSACSGCACYLTASPAQTEEYWKIERKRANWGTMQKKERFLIQCLFQQKLDTRTRCLTPNLQAAYKILPPYSINTMKTMMS